jgi:hypothetical protein
MEIRSPAVAAPIEDTDDGASGPAGGRPADGTL